MMVGQRLLGSWLVAFGCAFGAVGVGTATAQITVYDPAAYGQALAQLTELRNQLEQMRANVSAVQQVGAQIGTGVQFVQSAASDPTKFAKNLGQCLFSFSIGSTQAGQLPSLCEMSDFVIKNLIVQPDGNGAQSPAQVTEVRNRRGNLLAKSGVEAVALGGYAAGATKEAQTRYESLASQTAAAGNTQAGSAAMTNRILLAMLEQQMLTNNLLAKQLELQGAVSVSTLPMAVGVSK